MKCPRCHSPRVFPDYEREKKVWRDKWLYAYVCHWCGNKFYGEQVEPGGEPSYKPEGLESILRLTVPDATPSETRDLPQSEAKREAVRREQEAMRHQWALEAEELARAQRARKRRRRVLKGVVGAVVILSVAVVAYSAYVLYGGGTDLPTSTPLRSAPPPAIPTLEPVPTRPPIAAPSPTTRPPPSPTRAPTPQQASRQELAQYMLDLINGDRASSGLSPVTLGNNAAVQQHAEEMLASDYLSHWGLDGMKPYMRYTLAGGFNYEAENVFITRTTWSGIGIKDPFYRRDPKEMLNEAEQSLMGSPGHRRNILNKWHKRVNLGIAYDRERLTLVQQFEGDYVQFQTKPVLTKSMLSLSGVVSLGTVKQVSIYYDSVPQPMTPVQLNATSSYSLGDRVATILPPPPAGSRYIALKPEDVIASQWTGGSQFAIEADVGGVLARGKGIYTIVIWVEVGGEYVDLTRYSVFVQ